MTIDHFEHHMETSIGFARAMRHNVRASLFTAQQFAVCNLKHTLFARCARWLAMTEDRVGRSTFSLSSDFLAIMLGADADLVFGAMNRLEQLGAIRTSGSSIDVLDAGILRSIGCECYDVAKAAFAASAAG
jgi:hypothetical protein